MAGIFWDVFGSRSKKNPWWCKWLVHGSRRLSPRPPPEMAAGGLAPEEPFSLSWTHLGGGKSWGPGGDLVTWGSCKSSGHHGIFSWSMTTGYGWLGWYRPMTGKKAPNRKQTLDWMGYSTLRVSRGKMIFGLFQIPMIPWFWGSLSFPSFLCAVATTTVLARA